MLLCKHLQTTLQETKPPTPSNSTMSLLAPRKSQHVLISWPEEDSLSIISVRKLLSSPDELEVGGICKVQNYEQCLTRVIAVGSESEMDSKLLEVIKEDKLTALPSPNKKRKASISLLDSNSQGTPSVQPTTDAPSAHQQKSFLLPEPDTQWYRHTLTPRKPKQVKILSTHNCTIANTAPISTVDKQEVMMATLMDMIVGLKKNMDMMVERMDRLESAVSESQRSNVSTREIPPPLPPRNTPKSFPTQLQPRPVTHDVSLTIPPGYLIPVKLTDL